MAPLNRSVLTWVAICSSLLAACGTGSPSPTVTSAAAVQRPGLSNVQKVTVTTAARQMVDDPAATVHGLKARSSAGTPGLHVCGYVRRPAGASTPLYVELREADGATTAERGQIGATPANLAKVRFMCREHGDW